MEKRHGDKQVKHVKVMERVYEPRRLRQAWQQVKQNAGAAGIDQMTVEVFEQRKDELLMLIHEKLKAGTYRFKPARRALIRKEVRFVMNLQWLRRQGLIFLHDYTQKQQPLELTFSR